MMPASMREEGTHVAARLSVALGLARPCAPTRVSAEAGRHSAAELAGVKARAAPHLP
jgi:hypothetical protein